MRPTYGEEQGYLEQEDKVNTMEAKFKDKIRSS
jgi:hypothetical protein